MAWQRLTEKQVKQYFHFASSAVLCLRLLYGKITEFTSFCKYFTFEGNKTESLLDTPSYYVKGIQSTRTSFAICTFPFTINSNTYNTTIKFTILFLIGYKYFENLGPIWMHMFGVKLRVSYSFTQTGSRSCLVSVVTRLRVGRLEFDSQHMHGFFLHRRPPSLLSNGYRGLFPRS
jgi:hypothetical protein